MTTFKTLSVFALLITCVFVPQASAQTIITPTTLSQAIADGSSKQIVVASTTNITAPNFSAGTSTQLYIDRELLDVENVSGTTITVRRGAGGTGAASHASGALVFPGAPTQFFTRPLQTEFQGSCTRSTEPVLPRINVQTGTISDCLGGYWVNGSNDPLSRFRIVAPDSGGTAYTSLNTNGTTLSATTLYCSEVILPSNKLLTGIAILNGTTVGTDNHYVVLYDASGKALANSALAGAVSSGASTYQQYAFTSKFFAVGRAQYFACFQTNGTTDTVRMVVTGTQDTLLTKAQTSATFGTIPALTVPTTFTTAVGPYVYLY